MNNPEDPEAGKRVLPFSRELYIEREDFREEAPRKYFRMKPGQEVRLLHAYYVTCNDVVKDPDTGDILEIHCTFDPETRGGWSSDGRRVKGTLHWVSAAHCVEAEIREYDYLFDKADPEEIPEGQDFIASLKSDSLKVTQAKVEPDLANAAAGSQYQFVRKGYYVVDPDSEPGKPVFNQTVSLRDSWAKSQNKGKK